jgi:hypothetical protein
MVGENDGCSVGNEVGESVGIIDGGTVGEVGCSEGTLVGSIVGILLGVNEG